MGQISPQPLNLPPLQVTLVGCFTAAPASGPKRAEFPRCGICVARDKYGGHVQEITTETSKHGFEGGEPLVPLERSQYRRFSIRYVDNWGR